MAAIAMMVGGAILNATAFIGGNFLAKYFGGDKNAAKDALAEKKRHDRALEAYQAAYAKYTRNRTKLLDWIRTNEKMSDDAAQKFTDTDYAFKLYNKMHADAPLPPTNEPRFSDFYQPSSAQKNSEMLYVGAGALLLGYAAYALL